MSVHASIVNRAPGYFLRPTAHKAILPAGQAQTDPRTVADLGMGCLDWANAKGMAQTSAVSNWYTSQGITADAGRISAAITALNATCVDPRTLTVASGLAADCASWNVLQPSEKRGRVQTLANTNGWAFTPYDVQVGAQAVDGDCLRQGIAHICDPPMPMPTTQTDVDAWNAAHPTCAPLPPISTQPPFRPYQPIPRVGMGGAPGPGQTTTITPTASTPVAKAGIPWIPLAIGAAAVIAVMYFMRSGSTSQQAA